MFKSFKKQTQFNRLTPEQEELVNDRKVEVYMRLKPLTEDQNGHEYIVDRNLHNITVQHPSIKSGIKTYQFSKIYQQLDNQQSITESLSNEIYANCRANGHGCLVMSYGVTNSGKTFTILGTPEQPGLLPVLIKKLSQKMPDDIIKISAVENYCDDFYSLKTREKVVMKENNSRFEFQAQGEQINMQNVKDIIGRYTRNRNQANTRANYVSSRSHAIFKIYCGEYYIMVIDLAGSEKLHQGNQIFKETSSINSSLLVLGKCLKALEKGDHVPLRQSKLTQIMIEFFTLKYKVIMISHLNRSSGMIHENMSVLQYSAVSVNIKQMNMDKNKSVMKSFSKYKDKNERFDAEEQYNLMLKQHCKYFIYGMNYQYECELERQIAEQDRKDKQFLRQLREEGNYVTPGKRQVADVDLEIKKIESRMQFRELVQKDLEEERRSRMVDYGVGTGQSLAKNIRTPVGKIYEEEQFKEQFPKEEFSFRQQTSAHRQEEEQFKQLWQVEANHKEQEPQQLEQVPFGQNQQFRESNQTDHRQQYEFKELQQMPVRQEQMPVRQEQLRESEKEVRRQQEQLRQLEQAPSKEEQIKEFEQAPQRPVEQLKQSNQVSERQQKETSEVKQDRVSKKQEEEFSQSETAQQAKKEEVQSFEVPKDSIQSKKSSIKNDKTQNFIAKNMLLQVKKVQKENSRAAFNYMHTQDFNRSPRIFKANDSIDKSPVIMKKHPPRTAVISRSISGVKTRQQRNKSKTQVPSYK